MINRRILRIKALQALYAYEQNKDADYNLSLNSFDELFINVNYEDIEKETLKEYAREAKALFRDHVQQPDKSVKASENLVVEQVEKSIKSYLDQAKKDKRRFLADMVKEVDALYKTYLSVLLLLQDMARISEDFKRKNLVRNQLIELLRKDKSVEAELSRNRVSWSGEYDTIRGWFRDIINKDKVYIDYEKLDEPSFEEDRLILNHILKKVIFKNDSIQDFMSSNDLHWSENKSIVRSLSVKTFKSMSDSNPEVELKKLSYNWEEDKEFFEALYTETLSHEDQLEPVIAENSKNWEYDRIASLDKIILRMALTEMIKFPSIPVKVTINEYLEIAKLYSTPKSKQFINGVLDHTAKKLMKEGVIRKSGRGLIDNK